jgi:hypothetical protein
VRIAPNPDTGEKVVVFEAADGERNSVGVWTATTSIDVSDGGPSSGFAIEPEAPCVTPHPDGSPPPQPTNAATCPRSGVDLIAASLGDEADFFGGMIYSLPVAVAAGSGGDSVYGGSLDDLLLGEEGLDILNGGPGNDVLDGGPGPDQISGGDVPGYPANGFDLVDYSDRVVGVSVSLDGRTNDGEPGEGDTVGTNVEDVAGGSGPDVIVGSDVSNELYGEEGNDTIDGGPDEDLLDGGGGDDTLRARDGAIDRLSCGSGNDTAVVDADDVVAPDCETAQRPRVAAAPPPVAATPTPPDRTPPNVSMTVPKRPSLGSIIARGLRIGFTISEPSTVKAELQVTRAIARRLGLPTRGASSVVVIGRGTSAPRAAGRESITLKLTAKARRGLRRLRQARMTLRITATDPAGNAKTVTASLTAR